MFAMFELTKLSKDPNPLVCNEAEDVVFTVISLRKKAVFVLSKC